jgi:hypothetical protein
MAKVKVTSGNIPLFIKQSAMVGGETLRDMGAFTVNRIQKVTRSGQTMAGARRKSLKPLAESTIKFRRSARASREADKQFFKPAKSNLTLTGQLLDALKFSTSVRRQKVEIDLKKRRRNPFGTASTTNPEVAKFAADGGRPFIGMDSKGRKSLNRIVSKGISKSIRKRRRKEK